MTKKILLVVLGVLILAGALAGIKFLQIRTMIAAGSQVKMPPTPVTTTVASRATWSSSLQAVGTLSAVQGVTVTAELAGKITRIAFEAGKDVRQGELLVQQDVSTEKAQLPGAEAEVELTRLSLKRIEELLAKDYTSQAEFDAAAAAHRQARAQIAELEAAVAKKTIQAPFAGQLGIRLVNLGEMLAPGQPIVSLQSLDPLFVEFLLPQQQLAQVAEGMTVQLTGDVLTDPVSGTITAINPQVDAATRNVRLQAMVSNPGKVLRPGMFVNVAVQLPGERPVLTLPATAVLYAPYGDSVFIVEKPEGAGEGEDEDKSLVLRQQFVRLGETRGDYVAVLSGVEPDERVASTGVFKLRNGMPVVVDDSHEPEFQLEPKPENR